MKLGLLHKTCERGGKYKLGRERRGKSSKMKKDSIRRYL